MKKAKSHIGHTACSCIPSLLGDGLGLALVADVDEAVDGLLAGGEGPEKVARLEGQPGLQEVLAGPHAAYL